MISNTFESEKAMAVRLATAVLRLTGDHVLADITYVSAKLQERNLPVILTVLSGARNGDTIVDGMYERAKRRIISP